MGCDLVNGRILNACNEGKAGIKTLYFTKISNFVALSGVTESGGEITSLGADTIALYQFDMDNNVGAWEQTLNAVKENGTSFVEQIVTLALSKIKAADLVNINPLKKGRWAIFALDYTGKIRLFGRLHGCSANGGVEVSGIAAADKMGHELKLAGNEGSYAPFLADYTTEPFDNFTNVILFSGAWTPASIGDLSLWLDAADSATVSLNGNKVVTWTDKAVNNGNVTQGNDALRPDYNAVERRIDFDAAQLEYLQSSAFTSPVTQKNTIFIVGKGTGASHTFIDSIDTTDRQIVGSTATNFYINAGVNRLGQATDVNEHIITAFFDGVNSYIAIDGGSILTYKGDAGIKGMAGLTVGANYLASAGHMTGWIKEIIIYDKELTDIERETVRSYLNAKYSVY